MEKLPIAAAKDVAEKYNLDQVILIARQHRKPCTVCDGTGQVHSHNPLCWACKGRGSLEAAVHFVTYGKSDADSGMAALDGRKLAAVMEASPTSLEDAVDAANLVRPRDVKDHL